MIENVDINWFINGFTIGLLGFCSHIYKLYIPDDNPDAGNVAENEILLFDIDFNPYEYIKLLGELPI